MASLAVRSCVFPGQFTPQIIETFAHVHGHRIEPGSAELEAAPELTHSLCPAAVEARAIAEHVRYRFGFEGERGWKIACGSASSRNLKCSPKFITPARALESLRSILMVEVWFTLRDGGQLCLPRITEPEKEQALLLHHLAWQLPTQPPPRIYRHQVLQPRSANQATSRKSLP
jgi:hypothetical protein